MEITETGVAVEELVEVVRNAVATANSSSTSEADQLRATAIRLTLHTVATASAGGGLDFRVPFLGMRLRLGAAVSQQDTHTVDMVLVPSDLPRHRLRESEIGTVLVDAIETIRRVMARAAEGDDPFLLDRGCVDLSFAVTKSGSISLGVDGELKDELTHRLRVELARQPG